MLIARVVCAIGGLLAGGCSEKIAVGDGAVIFLGDSLTSGHGLPQGTRLYPEILGEKWGRKIVNLSASGIRADQAMDRYWTEVEKIPKEEVVACFVALGANDQIAGRTAAEAEGDLREISERMRENGWRVFFVQSLVPLRGGGYRDAYLRLADEAGTPLSSDIVGAYLGVPGGVQDGSRSHPSAKGQVLIAEALDGDFGRIMTQNK